MTKSYLIPIVLLAVIMVAGIFAFSPVDSASTVHGDLQTEVEELKDTFCTAFNDNTDFESVNDVCTDID